MESLDVSQGIRRGKVCKIQDNSQSFFDRFFSDAVDMVAEKEDVLAKLRALERNYNQLQRNPSTPRVDHRPLGWLQDWMQQKPPFRAGDDVWTRMEEKTRLFVEEMSGRR